MYRNRDRAARITRQFFHVCTVIACSSLALGCGVLGFGGTDGESSFLDGKTRTIGATSQDQKDGQQDASADPANSSVGQAVPSSEAEAGSVASPTYVGAWTITLAPSECVAELTNPIAGCDPEVNATWDLDCDGDGVADHVAYECDPANTELGPAFYGPYDCAPDDPSRAVWVATDFDADGHRGNGEFNCSSPSLPDGYVPNLDGEAYDCDDENRDVHPNATETWGDSVDSDCNGADFPDCESIASPGSWKPQPVERSDCAQGANLHFLDPAFCGERCRTEGTFYLPITNSGNAASPADVRIGHTDDTGEVGEQRLPAIAPGAMTLIAVSFTHATEIRVVLDFDDCSLDDNELVLPAGGDKVCLY